MSKHQSETAAESKLEDFAADLGKLLGTAQTKAESWLGQRKQIADTLVGIQNTASKLLAELGQQAAAAVQRARRGRPKGSANTKKIIIVGGKKRKRRRKMSAEARAKIAAAQKKRWAKVKREKKK